MKNKILTLAAMLLSVAGAQALFGLNRPKTPATTAPIYTQEKYLEGAQTNQSPSLASKGNTPVRPTTTTQYPVR